eukprot:SAG22_NODE_7333_length_750_cov_1.414747_2_plen_59_part_00
MQLYQSRAQHAELVPVLLLLAELHQRADSPVTALPAVLCCLSLCDSFALEVSADSRQL